MKGAVARYEKVAGAKVNLDKIEGLRLGAWWGEPFLYQDLFAGATDPSASSGCVLGPVSNWNEIGRKYELREKRRWVPGFEGGCS